MKDTFQSGEGYLSTRRRVTTKGMQSHGVKVLHPHAYDGTFADTHIRDDVIELRQKLVIMPS